MTQKDLAELLELNQGTVSRIENGECAPDLRAAILLSRLARRRGAAFPVDVWANMLLAS